jgi:hypothetical protein
MSVAGVASAKNSSGSMESPARLTTLLARLLYAAKGDPCSPVGLFFRNSGVAIFLCLSFEMKM